MVSSSSVILLSIFISLPSLLYFLNFYKNCYNSSNFVLQSNSSVHPFYIPTISSPMWYTFLIYSQIASLSFICTLLSSTSSYNLFLSFIFPHTSTAATIISINYVCWRSHSYYFISFIPPSRPVCIILFLNFLTLSTSLFLYLT